MESIPAGNIKHRGQIGINTSPVSADVIKICLFIYLGYI